MLGTKRSKVNVIIREDDVCYFTKPQTLERIYKPLLDLNLPVNLAVIPMVSCKLNKPFIDQNYRWKDIYLNIGMNKDLIEFIKQHNFEVLQHGLTHEQFWPNIPEFKISDEIELKKRAKLGIKILHKTFGERPRFFVPPWDVLSKQAYKIISKLYNGVILASMSPTKEGILGKLCNFIPKSLPVSFIPQFIICRLKNSNYCKVYNKFVILEDRWLTVSQRLDQETLLCLVNEFLNKWIIVVIVIHHWLLSSDVQLLDTWHKLLNSLLTDNRISILSAYDTYRLLV